MVFTIDKGKRKVLVSRRFAASISKVWNAWTKSELIDQWWAPKPWQAKTKIMNFEDGGFWLYAMRGPDGTEIWGRADFKNIVPFKSFSGKDTFCDKDGNINEDMPISNWVNNFKEEGKFTIVSIEIKYDELEDLEAIIKMGFEEGFKSALGNLDDLLKKNMILNK